MKKVLILEDELMLSETVKDMLKDKFEITLVESCKRAKELLSSEKFDLLFTDVNLPDGNSVSLVKWMAANSITCPVIYSSGNDHREFTNRFGPLSVDEFIEKPYRVRDLTDKFNSLLVKRSA
jgi:two-component system response regulator HydG